MLQKLWRFKKQLENPMETIKSANSNNITQTAPVQDISAPQTQTTEQPTIESAPQPAFQSTPSADIKEPMIPLKPSDFNFFHFSHNSEKLQLMQFAQFLSSEVENRRQQRVASAPETEPLPAKDAEVHILVSNNKMSAFLIVLPPEGTGKHVTAQMIKMQASIFKIKNFLDDTIFDEIEKNHTYLHVYQIAEGKPPIDGEDGSIVEHFSREQTIHLQEDEHGMIDYRNLGIFQTIQKGTPICDITLPKRGEDGYDVTGRVLTAKGGKGVDVPKGKNTILSEDGTQLLADADGNLVFEHNRFCIHEKLFISTDVDGTTGNIDFPGDIEIKGDVRSGFSITSGGSISIRGLVENATIVATKDVHIGNGMKGSGTGSVKADGNVTSKFFENCKVYAKGNIFADSFLNCKLYTDQTLEASGIGIIIGCDITANAVHAKSIGNPSGHLTKIELSHSYLLAQDLAEKEKELSSTVKILSTLEPNIKFLSQLGELDAKKKGLFQQLLQQKELYEEKKVDLETTIVTLRIQLDGIQSCHIKANTLFAPVQIVANGVIRYIDSTTKMCFIFLDEKTKEIVIGTF